MTTAQKIAVKLADVRRKLNTLSALEGDDFTPEKRAELEAASKEYDDLEVRHAAALRTEGADESAQLGETGAGDGEPAEVRRLLDRVSLTDYLTPAGAGVGLVGAPAELSAALKLPTVGPRGGVAIPWAMLLTEQRTAAPAEARAFTTTGAYPGGIMARPILQRLFGPSIMDALGVRMDSVPVGRSEWPLITGGVAPTQKAETDPADAAVSASFDTELLRPKRLTGKYEFTHEQAAQVPELETALRRDLADAVQSAMSNLIMNGDEATNPQEVDGFLTTIPAPTAPGAETTYAEYASSHAASVDGIHATMEMQCSSVIGVSSYQHAAGVFQAGSGESGTEALARRSSSCMASAYIPAAAGTPAVQDGNIFHAAGPNGGGADMRGDSVAAVWPTLEVIRDNVTQASQGVVLTWVTLWDAQTAFRAAAYRRVAFRLA